MEGTTQLVLGQVCRERTECRASAVPWLLDLMDVSGCVVTVDAPCSGPELARCLLGRNAEYVISLRPEYGPCFDQVEARFQETRPFETFRNPDDSKPGPGPARRWGYQRNDLGFLTAEGWEGLSGIGMVETRTACPEGPQFRRRYYASSLSGNASDFFAAVETHSEVAEGTLWTVAITFPDLESMANVAGTFALLKESIPEAA